MFDPSNLFHSLLVIPILNALIGIYVALRFIHAPGALGFSVILLTVVIRLILHPLTASQLRNAQKLSRLKPALDTLSAKHKSDKQRLHQEQLALYKREGIHPASGCLPLLLQMPILIGLYNLFFTILNTSSVETVVQQINAVVYFPFLHITTLDTSFFGINLAYRPSEWQQVGWWLLSIPVLTGILQYWQGKLMVPSPSSSPDTHAKQQASSGEKKEDDVSVAMQKQMVFLMPMMIGFFAYSFSIGLSLYWNTYTIFGIIQQYKIQKDS